MKGKIVLWLLLWAVWAIYAFLIYPLLQNTPTTTSPREISSNVASGEETIEDRGEKEDANLDDTLLVEQPKVQEIQEEVIEDTQENKPVLCIDDICFTIEVADTPALRAQWLMNRSSLAQDAGMLFVFDTQGSYSFRMKNTLIPLDIIRLDDDFIVIDTATMQPCTQDPCPSYAHSGQAMYALEINAGLVQQYQIEVGDTFILK